MWEHFHPHSLSLDHRMTHETWGCGVKPDQGGQQWDRLEQKRDAKGSYWGLKGREQAGVGMVTESVTEQVPKRGPSRDSRGWTQEK